MQNSDEASSGIIFADQALLVKMLVTLELRFWFKFCILIVFFNIFQPLVCKTVTRLHRASFLPVKLIKFLNRFVWFERPGNAKNE